jgi:hypothetical protein
MNPRVLSGENIIWKVTAIIHTYNFAQKRIFWNGLMKLAAETCVGRQLHARRKDPAGEVIAHNLGRGKKIWSGARAVQRERVKSRRLDTDREPTRWDEELELLAARGLTGAGKINSWRETLNWTWLTLARQDRSTKQTNKNEQAADSPQIQRRKRLLRPARGLRKWCQHKKFLAPLEQQQKSAEKSCVMGTKTGYARNKNIYCSKRICPAATGQCDRTKSRSRLGGAEHWAALLCEQKFRPAAGRIGLCSEKKTGEEDWFETGVAGHGKEIMNRSSTGSTMQPKKKKHTTPNQDAKHSFSLNSDKNPYKHGGYRHPSLI